MTRLGRALRFTRSLRRRLRDPYVDQCQLTDFDVSAGVCALPYSGPFFSSMSSTQLMRPLGLT